MADQRPNGDMNEAVNTLWPTSDHPKKRLTPSLVTLAVSRSRQKPHSTVQGFQ
jgi:hypothetical protein